MHDFYGNSKWERNQIEDRRGFLQILSTKLMMNEWRMANSWNVMFRDRHGDKFTLSTQLPTQN